MARLQIFRSSLLAAAVAAAFFPVASERADAATLTWDGGGTNNNWSTINNWNPNQLPANFDSLIFAGSVRTSPSNDIDSFFVSSLTFAPGAAAFTLGGSGFATGSFTGTAAFLNLGTNVQTINNPLAFNGATNINNTSGSTGPLTFNGAIQLFGANVTVGGTSVVTFNGALTTSDTSGTLTVNPASTLVLGVANAVPAVYNVAVNGSLRMNGVVQTFANLAGNGFVDLGTATLEVGGGQFSGRISGTGGVTKIGSGGLTLSGFNTYAGPTRVLAGTLSTPSGGALPSGTALDVTGGVLDAGSSNQIVASLHLANGSVAGGGTLRATGDISLESGFASARIGGANLIKSTAGRVTLAAPVLSANSIVVTDGTLELLASNLLPGTDMTVQAPGTVNLGGFSATLRNIAGDGSIALGTGGVLTVGADNQSSAFGGIITGAPNGAGQGGLRKVGNGSLALSAVLQSGGITIDAGTLELPNGVASSGAVLRVNPSGTLLAKGIVNRPIAAAVGSHLSATGDLILGDLTGAGGVSILGTLDAGSHRVQLVNLAGASLGGTVLIGERGQLTAFDQLSGMVLEAGGTLNASGNAFVNGNFVNRGRVNGPGASGSSLVFTDDVSGPGSYGGNVSFLQGFSPGASPAAVSLGNASFAATSTLLMELGGRTSGSQYDQLLVSGLLELQGGLLDVVLIDGFSPHAGDSFDLFDWGSLGGSFGSIHLPSLGSQLAWNTSRLYVDGTLAVAAIPEAEIYAMIAAGLLGIGWRRRRHGPLSTF